MRNYLNCLRLRRRWINLGLSSAPLWPSDRPRRCARVCDRAGPEFLVSLAEAGQRGWAAKRGDTMAHVVWFPGNGSENTGAIVPGIIIPLGGPSARAPQGHSRGWKGISLGLNWRDATLNPGSCQGSAFMHIISTNAEGSNSGMGQVAGHHQTSYIVHKVQHRLYGGGGVRWRQRHISEQYLIGHLRLKGPHFTVILSSGISKQPTWLASQGSS